MREDEICLRAVAHQDPLGIATHLEVEGMFSRFEPPGLVGCP
jgi:hypothetical protein